MRREYLETLVGALGAVDHRRVEWENVRWTAYLIHQHLRYEYPAPIHDLRQRLVVVPPDHHGGQRLVTHHLEVSAPGVEAREGRDAFGNLVMELWAERVEQAIDFTVWVVIERDAAAGPIRAARGEYEDLSLREPSRLTMPDRALRAAAAGLRKGGGDAGALAARINEWVHERMAYAPDATGVRTTASEALALRRGVCQDYSHIMLALCRLCGLPARYVSGHLLGEGGTHAWVEVLLPDPSGGGGYVAQPFDPTHGNVPSMGHITVAVGRDYGDVAPTSGSFRAPHGGKLSTRKLAGVTALEYYTPAP